MTKKNAKGNGRALVISVNDITVKLPKEYNEKLITREIKLRDNIDAPIKKYEELGTIHILYDGMEVGSSKIASYNEIDKSNLKLIKNKLFDFIKAPVFWIIALSITTIIYIKKKKSSSK